MFSIHRLCTYYSRHDKILWMASRTSPMLHSRLQSSRKSLMVLQPVLQPRHSPRSPYGPILSHGTLRRSQKTNSHVHDSRPLLTAVEHRCTTRPTERSEHIRRRPEALGRPDHQISRQTRRDMIYRHEHPPDDMRPVNQAAVVADIQTREPFALVGRVNPPLAGFTVDEVFPRAGNRKRYTTTVTPSTKLLRSIRHTCRVRRLKSNHL